MSDFDDDDNYDQEVAAKKRRIKFEYEEINTFNTVEELEKFQETLKNQGLHKKSETEGGWENIITYECKETKRGCKYVLIIKTSHENSVSTVRHRTCGHDHSNSKSSGLTKEIKELILAHSHLTATRIQKKLKEYGLPILPVLQINNFLTRERKRKRETGGMPPNRHWSWDFYETFSYNTKLAKCYGCGQQYSNGSVSRMTRHLKKCDKIDGETKAQILIKIEEEPLTAKASINQYTREGSATFSNDDPEELCKTLEEVIKAATSMPENTNADNSEEFNFNGIPFFQTNNEHFLADTDITDEANGMLVKFFKSGYIASNFVENEDFKKFIHILNPSYILPSKETLDKLIHESEG